MIYLGVDPGRSGAIAAIDEKSQIIGFVRFKDTVTDVADWIAELDCPASAMIEKVGATPQMGVVSAFKFGRSYGTSIGLLTASRIRHEFVSPGVWQRSMGCLTGGDKNVSKAAAQALWPMQKMTHAIADAFLIAEYGRRKDMGK